MKAKLSRLIKTDDSKKIVVPLEDMEQAKWTARGGEILTFENEWCVKLRTVYPLETVYHDFTYDKAKQAMGTTKHPFFTVDVPPEQVLFMDTETTGLRGSGTSIFLIGFARFQSDFLEMVQYVLPHPAFETAFYYHFLNDIGDEVRFVTYNGKSFDWPQIKTRHTFVKSKVKALPAVGHVDLLHAARRLLKPTLESVSLKAVEAHFGHARIDDLPGFLAPMHYFQYVKDQEPDILQPVIDHHHADCLSLVSLYSRLCHLVEEEKTIYGEERAHWLNDLGSAEEALVEYDRITQPTKRAKMRQAMLLKRTGRIEQALPLFEDVGSIDAYVELAKHAEHRSKDIPLAIRYTEQAIALAEKRETILKQVALKELEALRHRLARLERKKS